MPQETTNYTFTFLIVGIVVIFFFVIFFYLFVIQLHRRRILHQKEVVDLKVQYEQTILQSQLEIQEQTFKNISQEIHDNIGQVLSLAKLNLNTIQHTENGETIALTEELLGKAIGDLRDLSRSLNSEKITDIGICLAIKHELGIIEKVAKIKTVFNCFDEEVPLGNEQTIIAFRMMQEILNNILKHAKASLITADIATVDDKYTAITITDNGKGFDIDKLDTSETGIGLKSIQQRCKLINATCNINTAPGKGTVIKIVIENNYNKSI